MKKNSNNIINKIFNSQKKQLVIIIGAILLSLFMEVVIFNFNYFIHNPKGSIDETFTSYKDENNYIIEVSDIDRYVKEVSISYKNKTNRNVEFLLYYYDNDNTEKVRKDKMYLYTANKMNININKNVNKIKIILDCTEDEIVVNSIETINVFTFNLFRFFVIGASLYILFDLMIIIFSKKKIKLHQYYFKTAMIIAVMYSILTPIYHTYDEKEHMVRSYNIAQFNFLQQKDEYIKWPDNLSEFIDNPSLISSPTTFSTYKYNFNWLNKIGQDDYVEEVHNSTASPYLFPAYLISGAGIFVAKMLGLSFPFQFYLGRIFNAIAYVIITTFAIKYSGKYSKLFLFVSLIPAIIFMGSSFSADMMTNAMALLSVALTLYYRDKEEILNKKNLLILGIVYVLSFISKIAYFPISLLVLIIPNKKFKNKKSAISYKCLVIFLSGLLFLIGTIYANKIGIVQWPRENVDSIEQLKFIITNPISYLNAIFTTINNSFISILKSATTSLSYCGYYGDALSVLTLLIAIFTVISTCKNNNIKIMDKFILGIVILAMLGASMSSLYISYTPVGSTYVDGYQGRYLTPMFIPFLLLFTTKKIKLNMKENSINTLIMASMIFLNIYGLAMILCNYYL